MFIAPAFPFLPLYPQLFNLNAPALGHNHGMSHGARVLMNMSQA